MISVQTLHTRVIDNLYRLVELTTSLSVLGRDPEQVLNTLSRPYAVTPAELDSIRVGLSSPHTATTATSLLLARIKDEITDIVSSVRVTEAELEVNLVNRTKNLVERVNAIAALTRNETMLEQINELNSALAYKEYGLVKIVEAINTIMTEENSADPTAASWLLGVSDYLDTLNLDLSTSVEVTTEVSFNNDVFKTTTKNLPTEPELLQLSTTHVDRAPDINTTISACLKYPVSTELSPVELLTLVTTQYMKVQKPVTDTIKQLKELIASSATPIYVDEICDMVTETVNGVETPETILKLAVCYRTLADNHSAAHRRVTTTFENNLSSLEEIVMFLERIGPHLKTITTTAVIRH